MWDTCELFVNYDVTCDWLCWIMYDLDLYVDLFEILRDFIGLSGLYGLKYDSWSLWWLLLYLCSYKLDSSVTGQARLGLAEAGRSKPLALCPAAPPHAFAISATMTALHCHRLAVASAPPTALHHWPHGRLVFLCLGICEWFSNLISEMIFGN